MAYDRRMRSLLRASFVPVFVLVVVSVACGDGGPSMKERAAAAKAEKEAADAKVREEIRAKLEQQRIAALWRYQHDTVGGGEQDTAAQHQSRGHDHHVPQRAGRRSVADRGPAEERGVRAHDRHHAEHQEQRDPHRRLPDQVDAVVQPVGARQERRGGEQEAAARGDAGRGRAPREHQQRRAGYGQRPRADRRECGREQPAGDRGDPVAPRVQVGEERSGGGFGGRWSPAHDAPLGSSMSRCVRTRSVSMRRRSARCTTSSTPPISIDSPRRGMRPSSCSTSPPIVSNSSSA